jgi:hypothetical protein
MSLELEDRLARLAPTVNVEVARAHVRARTVRARWSRRLAGAATCAMVAIVAVTIVSVATTDDDDGVRVQTTTPAVGPLRTTTTSLLGLEVAVTAPESITAGTRMWVDVVVRNRGAEPVYWQAGGCALLVHGALAPRSYVPPPGTSRPVYASWDGRIGDLADHVLARPQPEEEQRLQRDDATGMRSRICESDSRGALLRPGLPLTYRGSVEARVPPGALADDGRYTLAVTFVAYEQSFDYPDGGTEVTARVPVKIVDHLLRDNANAALTAFAADLRLRDWIEETSALDPPSVVQSYETELTWWRGAWELLVEPRYTHDPLRMRYDPTVGAVIDVGTPRQY